MKLMNEAEKKMVQTYAYLPSTLVQTAMLLRRVLPTWSITLPERTCNHCWLAEVSRGHAFVFAKFFLRKVLNFLSNVV